MLASTWKKNDKKAKWLIISFSIIMFLVIASLGRIHVEADLGFDVHVFALANAIINSVVAIMLIAGYVAVRKKNYLLHKKLMLTAIILSILFLISYICHHIFAGDTKFGGEGVIRIFYYFILITHILLAGIILPFILFTAYRGLTGDYQKHRKIAKITWPLWLYIAITGPLIYVLISPYY